MVASDDREVVQIDFLHGCPAFYGSELAVLRGVMPVSLDQIRDVAGGVDNPDNFDTFFALQGFEEGCAIDVFAAIQRIQTGGDLAPTICSIACAFPVALLHQAEGFADNLACGVV